MQFSDQKMQHIALIGRGEAGIQPTMASATAQRQDGLFDAMTNARVAYDAAGFSWWQLVDELTAGQRRG